MREPPRRLTLSVLDRLLGPPDGDDDTRLSETALMQRWKAGLCRDLEALLNARRRLYTLPSTRAFQELATSSLNFGLPGHAAGVLNDPPSRQALCEDIQRCITIFEPRLKQVRVSLADESGPPSSLLHLRIEAVLALEPVSFGTVLNATTGAIAVTERQ